jgi:outer membrane lipoprotein carrier protein
VIGATPDARSGDLILDITSRSSVLRTVLAIVALAALSTTAFTRAADNEEAAYRRLDSFLKEVTSFEAQFSQTQHDSNGAILDKSTGTLALQRPNRFRWDYREPHPQQIVADGTRIWLYDPDLEQVTVRKLDDSLGATPAMLLSGEGRLRDNFSITHTEQRGEIAWITLVPKRSDTDFKSVRLGFVGDTLRSMELADKLGQTTSVEFDQIKRNPAFDAQKFVFTPPAGADVIGDTGTKPKTP